MGICDTRDVTGVGLTIITRTHYTCSSVHSPQPLHHSFTKTILSCICLHKGNLHLILNPVFRNVHYKNCNTT